MKKTPTYSSWKAMVARCSNPKGWGFAEYGGKGVTVCERWKKFENFVADMGERPAGTSIDRIDGAKGYEPGNCRWATRSQQNLNRRKYVIANRNPNQGKSPGRPPLPEDERERLYLTIRVSAERKARYERAATKAKETLSAWVKRLLDRASR